MTVLRSIAAQLACLPSGHEQRQIRRRAVNFAATLESEGASAHHVQVLDLSEAGFRLAVEFKIEPSSSLLIKLPGCEALRAHVVWARGGEAGCAFDEPLQTATIDLVLGRKRAAAPRPVQRRSAFGLRGVL